MTESVYINSFWSQHAHGRPIIFHARKDPGTRCAPHRAHPACGHALPRDVAEKIAQPCSRCYPDPVTT